MWEVIKWSALCGVILAGLLVTYGEFWKDLNEKGEVPSKKYGYAMWFSALCVLGAMGFYVGAQWVVTVVAMAFPE